MLKTSWVLLFVRSENAIDREKVGPLLEMDEGLTVDWVVVKGVDSWEEFRGTDSGSNEGDMKVV